MKMKTKRFYLVALLMCALSVFTSCSKGSDNNGGGSTPAAPDTTPVSIKFVYMAGVSPDVVQYMDAEVEYLDESGNVKTEKITSAETWTKVITFKLPAKMGARLHLKKKSGVDYGKIEGLVKVGATLDRAYTLLNKSGGQLNTFNANIIISTLDMKGESVEKYIEGKGTNHKSFYYEYDASGKETKGSW
jgi:hypothetical protein